MVYPCCCGMNRSSYFNAFMIFYMILMVLRMGRKIYFTVRRPTNINIFFSVLDLAIFVWAGVVYVFFIRKNEFGNLITFIFSLAVLFWNLHMPFCFWLHAFICFWLEVLICLLFLLKLQALCTLQLLYSTLLWLHISWFRLIWFIWHFYTSGWSEKKWKRRKLKTEQICILIQMT